MQKSVSESIVKNVNQILNQELTAIANSTAGKIQDLEAFVKVVPPIEIIGEDLEELPNSLDIFFQGIFVPKRTIELSSYYLGKYQVTYKLWQEVVDWGILHGYTFKNSGRKGSHGDARNTAKDPVTEISWLDCIVWCNAYTEKEKGLEYCVYLHSDTGQIIKNVLDLSLEEVEYRKDRKGYRLPTEAEWEYAARFNGQNPDNLAEDNLMLGVDQLSGDAWHSGNSSGQTHAVGAKDANKLGLYDMSGNVWEWCYDGWQDCFPTGTQTNPCGSILEINRVVRGGGWSNHEDYCSVGMRGARDAYSLSFWDGVGYDLGFRLAYSQ